MKGYNTYKVANAETTDQGKLIIMLYDFVINNCVQAKENLENEAVVNKTRKLYKAQDGLTELMCALDMDKGAEVAKNLYRLYDYYSWRLGQANIKGSSAMVDEVIKNMRNLKEAWLVAINNVRKENGGNISGNRGTEGLRLVG